MFARTEGLAEETEKEMITRDSKRQLRTPINLVLLSRAYVHPEMSMEAMSRCNQGTDQMVARNGVKVA